MAEETTGGTSTTAADAQTLDDLTALQSASPTLDGEVQADVSVGAAGSETQPDSPSQFDTNIQPPLDGGAFSNGATATDEAIGTSNATGGTTNLDTALGLDGTQAEGVTQDTTGAPADSVTQDTTGAQSEGVTQAVATGGALDGGVAAADVQQQAADATTPEASTQTAASAATTETGTATSAATSASGEVIPGATDSTATPQPLTGGAAVPIEGTTSGLVVAAPALSLSKSVTGVVDVNGAARSSVAAAGDVVTFSVTVTNTGNTLLQNISVTDPLASTSLAGGLSLNPGESQSYSFNYIVTAADISNLGGGDSLIDSVATATSDIAATVSASAGANISPQTVSLPPVVADARLDVASGDTVSGQLSATDPDSTQLTFALTDGAPSGLTLNPNGSYSFTLAEFGSLAAGETRTFVAPYSVTDESGNVTTASFTITVTGTNDAPVATFTTAQPVNEDASLTGQ
ncbi:MAG: Hemolysin, chromosomal, partial [Pseudomonadota bacterium]